MQEIQIINNPSRDEPFLIINKPSGMPCAPLNENDTDNAFYHASKLYPELLEVKGKKEIEHGLIHRLDTITRGLFVIALTQSSYDNLIQQQLENRFIKTYSAECNIIEQQVLPGFPEIDLYNQKQFNQKKVESYFRFYGPGNKEVRPVSTESNNKYAKSKIGKQKLYNTEIKVLSQNSKKTIVQCTITNGFRHQVRCHLAWCGLPIINDPLYNSATAQNDILFTASEINFENPVTKEVMTYSII